MTFTPIIETYKIHNRLHHACHFLKYGGTTAARIKTTAKLRDNMSVRFSGTLRRSAGIVSAIGKHVKLINLKGVKRITVAFDPFFENVKPTRDFLFYLSTPQVANTNPNCVLRTDVLSNRSAPSVVFTLLPAVQEQTKLKEVKLDAANLNVLELITLCNKYVSSLAPKEVPVNVLKTKSEKKAAGGKAGKKR